MTFFPRPPTLTPCARDSLIAHSTVSEPVVSRKTFFSGSGNKPASRSTSACADFARKAVVVQETGGGLCSDSVDHFAAAVARIGNQHTG